mmetsp:Transcript_34539/g.90886  ORF Transcript_34539/g.90886 Transcript_34539/m.90886 type:complete len:1145 (-) Transcript_34539:172-3606(-)
MMRINLLFETYLSLVSAMTSKYVTIGEAPQGDAPDHIIFENTGGMYASCTALLVGDVCANSHAQRACPVTCTHPGPISKHNETSIGKDLPGCCAPKDCCMDQCICVNTRFGTDCEPANCCFQSKCSNPPPSPPPPRPPPPPPSPKPPPPPPQLPHTCAHHASMLCSAPPFFCHFDDGAKWVYDETVGDATSWDRECASEFWAAQAGPDVSAHIDWAAMEQSVSSCVGATCITSHAAIASPNAVCSKDCAKVGTDIWGGNGCVFTLDRYAPKLVFLSQMRAASILKQEGFVGNRTSQQTATAQLQEVVIALSNYLTVLRTHSRADSPTSGILLVQAQISSLNTVSTQVTRLPALGFVPSFTRDFYAKELIDYMASYRRIMNSLEASIQSDALLRLFVSQVNEEQAQLNGQKSVTQVSQQQTAATMVTAVTAMHIAQQELTRAGVRMQAAAGDVKDALDDWQTDQLIELSLTIAFTCADLATSAIGDMAARAGEAMIQADKSTSFFKRISTYYLMDFIRQFREGATTLGEAFAALGKVEAMLPPSVRDLSGTVAAQIAAMGIPDIPNTPSDPIQAITKAANDLNTILLGLGGGAWAEYVAQSKHQYNDFLTGYNSKVNGAATSYMDELHSQAAYGEDFVSAGARFVKTVQQYLINAAQLQAYNQTQQGINGVYKVASEEHEYDMLQEGIMTIQMTTLALQMHLTVEQLCQALEYQTTRLYKDCVGPGKENKLQEMCGDYANGATSFTPFLYEEPCRSGKQLASAAHSYMSKWTSIYNNALSVMDYVTTATWGTDSSATDSPFTSFELSVWDPPECVENQGYWDTDISICNTSVPARTNVTYIGGSSCLAPGALMPPHLTCCKITRWHRSCPGATPPNGPYVSRHMFKQFLNVSSEDWGSLQFSIGTGSVPQLSAYDEIFVRGASVYVEGAIIHPEVASNLFARLTPVGAMQTRVKNQSWIFDPACVAAFIADPGTMCMFTNYTFYGAPVGRHAVVDYTSYYHNPSHGSVCAEGTGAQPVFYDIERRELLCQDEYFQERPCFHYCSGLDFASLEDGNVQTLYGRKSPYNFASLYSTFKLQLHNKFSSDDPVYIRSAGIQLSQVKSVRIGMWLKTYGRNNARRDTCADIGHRNTKMWSNGSQPFRDSS